jgi:hypothetical protein
MPKTTPRAEAVTTEKPWNPKDAPRFVRCELNFDQKALLVTWAGELEDIDLLKWLEGRVMSGHTLSVRLNEVGYQCSLTGTREASGHVGMSLVARASTPLRALQGCMYRDELVLTAGWPISSLMSELDF